ncbi:uncharacterized protein isoform X7 [Rhodnius prolixus]|uniref:uncharacterized protein isoform X7 n=1 Tax=Rhodnius prolixus TaxID=13249 RepID=UPI003D18D616
MERPRITLEVTFRDDIDGEEVSLKGYFTFEVENHIITVRAASLPNNAVISAALTQDDGIITERGFKICSNVEGNEDVTKCLLCPCLLPTAMNQNDLPDWKQQGTRSDQCICCMHNDLAKQSQNKDAISTCHCDPAKRDGPELPTKIERLIQVTYELESELEETSKVPGPSEEQILEETPKMKCLCKEGAHADAAKKLPEQVVQSPTPNYEKDKPEQQIISPRPAMQEVRTPGQTPQKPSQYPPQGSPSPPKSAITTSPNQTKSKRTKDKPEQKIISPQPAKQEVRTPVQTPQKTSPCPPLGRPIPPKSASTTSPNQTKSMRTKDKPEQKIISPQPAKQEVRTPVQTPQKTSPCPPLGRPIPPKSASTTSPNQTKSMRTPAKQEVRTPVQTPQKTSPCPPLGRPIPPKSASTTSPNQTKSMRTKDKPEQKIISPQPAKQEVRTPVQTPQKTSPCPPLGRPSPPKSAFTTSPNQTKSMRTKDKPEQKIISPQPAKQEVRTPVQTPQKPSSYPPQGSPSTSESAFIASPNRTESKQTITRSDNLTDYRRLDGTLSTTTEDEQSFQYPQTRPGTPQFSSPETPQAGDRTFIGTPQQTITRSDNLTDYRRLDGTLSTTTDDEQSFQYSQTRPGTPQFSSPETPQAGDRAFIGSPHQTDAISTCHCDPAKRDGPELPTKIERLIQVTYELESELEETSKVPGPSEEQILEEKDKPEQKIISPQSAMQEVRTPVQTPQKPSQYPPQGIPSPPKSAFTASPNRTESMRTKDQPEKKIISPEPAMQEVRTPVQTPQKPSQYPPQGSPSTPESAFIASPNRTESKQTITRSDNLTDYRRLDGTLSTTTEDEQSFQYPQTRPGTPQFSSPETPQAGDRAFIGSPHQTGVSQPSPPDTDWASRKQPTKKVTFADETQYKEPPEELKEHHLGPIDTKLTRPEETFQDGEPFTSPRQFAHPTDKKRLAGPSGVDSPQPETAERGTPPKTAYQPPEYFDPNSSIVYSDPIASSTPLRLSLEDGVKLEQIPQPSKQVVQPETVGPVVQSAPVEQVEDLVLYDLIKEVYDLHKLSQNSDLEESKQGSFHEENEVGPLKALRAIHNQRMDELHKHAEKIYNKKYNQEELDTFRKVFDEHKSESREGVNFWDDSNFYVEVNRSLRELPNEKRASFTPGQNTSSAGFPSDLKKSRRKSSWVQRSSEFLRYSANSLKVKLGFNRPNTRSEVNRSTRLQFISVSEDNFFTNGYLMFVFHLFYELYTFIFQFT